MKLIKLIPLTVLMLSINVNAGSLVCDNTKVKKLAYHGSNKLMVQLDNMNSAVFFCNPDAEWRVSGSSYYMGPETCKAIYSTLLSAKVTGAKTRIHFEGDDVPSSCNGWENWKSAVIMAVSYE